MPAKTKKYEQQNNIYILYIIIKRCVCLRNDEFILSYAGFAQFSNDVEAYEAFFSKTFSECVSSTYDSQTPDNIRHFSYHKNRFVHTAFHEQRTLAVYYAHDNSHSWLNE